MILNDVTATISTRGRSTTTLPLVLSSLSFQNYKPGKIIVYDDNDSFSDPRKIEVINNVLNGLSFAGIQWYWNPGAKKGQIHNHEHARVNATTPFVWRIDDDNVLTPDTLESLYNCIISNPKIGAVGPCIIDPKNTMYTKLASNNIKDIYLGLNEQWIVWESPRETKNVEHLQGSTFLYRVEAAQHGYEMSLSKKGHREETIFTYEMVRAGWELKIIKGLNTMHYHFQSGGIRDDNNRKLAEQDEKIFLNKLKDWRVQTNNYKIIYLDSGRGDHYSFKIILPELLEKYKNYKIVIAVCWHDCFWDIKDENITFCSLQDASYLVNPEAHNVYKFMEDKNWKKSLTEAYRALYL